MLYAIIKRENCHDVGVNRDGTLVSNRGDFELMPRDTARVVADLHGGEIVSDIQLFPSDFQVDDVLE